MKHNQHFDYLFNPRSVAVIGASNTLGKWGYGILSVLLDKGGREIYPINHKESEVLGVKAYSNIVEVPGPVDLAVIAVPFGDVLGAMRDCVQKGVKAAVLVSAGFAEAGVEGAKVEREMVAIAREGGMRFTGPNCFGHFNTYTNLFIGAHTRPVKQGPVAIISQSGNWGHSILHLVLEMGMGISTWVSSGNEADLHFEDYLEYLARDEKTRVVLGYIEGFREGRRFWELAKKVTTKKPVIIMKSGRTEAGVRAAQSHSASLAGSDVVCEAALKQSGVIRVEDINELVDVALALLGQPLPRGKGVGVLSMGGGLGVTTADALRMQGLEVPSLSATTMEKLNTLLSDRWSHGNPVDPGGDLVIFPCLWPLLEDENIDAVIMIGNFGTSGVSVGMLAPTLSATVRAEVARRLKAAEEQSLKDLDIAIELMKNYQKPIIFVDTIPGVNKEGGGHNKLKRNYLMPYPTPDRAAKALSHLVEYSEYLRTSGED